MILARQFLILTQVENDSGCLLFWKELMQHEFGLLQPHGTGQAGEDTRATYALRKFESLHQVVSSGMLGQGMYLDEVLRWFKECQCSYPRDRVYGIMGIVRPSERIPIDYSLPIDDIWQKVFVRILGSRDYKLEAEEIAFLARKIDLAKYVGNDTADQWITLHETTRCKDAHIPRGAFVGTEEIRSLPVPETETIFCDWASYDRLRQVAARERPIHKRLRQILNNMPAGIAVAVAVLLVLSWREFV